MNREAQIDLLVKAALLEDIGEGDHSTISTIDPVAIGVAVLKIKQDGVLAGLSVAQWIFRTMDPEVAFIAHKNDGDFMTAGEKAFEVKAKVHTILECERVVLNCMQRMSGIASLTRKYVNKLEGYHTKLLDTRKTTPNFRVLEKEAVRLGGAFNHRFGLYDMIMLKDNHIDYCGGIKNAIEKAFHYVQMQKNGLKIEVETRSMEEVEIALQTGRVDRIMLDNFSPDEIKVALKLIGGKYETEASGGIHYDNLELYAATGVDFISSGAIIHQAQSLDLSLKAVII
jgi:nicotinate-nucleotide pyrophosphorylase (carboxylating)